MTDERKYNIEEYRAIQDHNDKLSHAAQTALDSMLSVQPHLRPDYMKKNIMYWKNVIAAMKWSTRLAQQMTRKADDGGTTA